MGMTPFVKLISLKGSATYLFASPGRWLPRAIPKSGACDSAVLPRLGFVWLFRVLTATGKGLRRFGDGLGPGRPSPHSYFYKCRISRMIGVIQQIVEHSGYSNV